MVYRTRCGNTEIYKREKKTFTLPVILMSFFSAQISVLLFADCMLTTATEQRPRVQPQRSSGVIDDQWRASEISGCHGQVVAANMWSPEVGVCHGQVAADER